MKVKRSHRMVDLTYTLLEHPHEVISLPTFTKKYGAAKSSLSEDMAILNEQFQAAGVGRIETTPGVSGGIVFIPAIASDRAHERIEALCERLLDDKRILPGGYFYLSDVLSEPAWLRLFGAIIATRYQDAGATVILTIASKGIALAGAVANELNVPFVTAQRKAELTEGSTVSVNYVTRRSNGTAVETMALTKSSLKPADKVLIVDDFMNGGGTFNGMLDLVREFESECVGGVVCAERADAKEAVRFPYRSLVVVEQMADDHTIRRVTPGSIFNDAPFAVN